MNVGYGKVCVTPPMGSPAGKGLYHALESVIDDIYVRAVYIETDSRRVLIAAMEAVGLYPADIDYFTAGIAQATGLKPDEIIIHATHTHSGPGSRWEIGDVLEPFGIKGFGGTAQYRKTVAEGFIGAAKAAVESAEPCRMAYSEAKVTGVASNRRLPVEGTNTVVFRPSRPRKDLRERPEGVIDPTVRVVLFRSDSGKRTIGICNYCCHPSSGGGDHSPYLSADFPGYGMRFVEGRVHGLEMMHLTGTCGDINPGAHVTGYSTDIEDRKKDIVLLGTRYGEALWEAVRAANDWRTADHLRLRWADVSLPLSPERPGTTECRERISQAAAQYKTTGVLSPELHRLAQAYLVGLRGTRSSVPTRLAAMKLGDICFTFLPGEIFLQFGESLRSVSPGPLLNVALCHDYSISYVVQPDCFAEGGYEPKATFLAPDAYDRLLEAAKKTLIGVEP
jgi:hypothetical protein